jgi:hypothetical protein
MYEYVRVDSPLFGRAHGYVQAIREDGTIQVRLELEDDHPAMRDAVADGFDADQAEFIDIVPAYAVQTVNGEPYERSYAYREAMATHRKAEHTRRLQAARERVRSNRLRLPELDASRRARCEADGAYRQQWTS